MKKTVTGIALTGSLLISSLVMGQAMGSLPAVFGEADKDANGLVSKEELAPFVAGGQLENLFTRWNCDKNEGLDEKEYSNRAAGCGGAAAPATEAPAAGGGMAAGMGAMGG